MRQAFNPFLPSYEYIPDGEPHAFDGRVYVYGSHDRFDGKTFCLNDYVCWSAPENDLTDWRYEGVIFERKNDPLHRRSKFFDPMCAPDCCRGADGRYYLYYFLGGTSRISVAVCDSPAGTFSFYGHVRYADGSELGSKGEPLQFDPGVLVDDDGKVYMYTGFGPVHYPAFLMGWHKPSQHGAMGFELCEDMLTVKTGPTYIGVKGKREGAGTPYEGHEFFEASSIRKYDGKYYFVYSAYEGHELCWAFSEKPLSDFAYGGTLVSNGDIGLHATTKRNARNYTGNNHGGLLRLKDDFYIFYHRHTNSKQFSRQACAEKIEFADGRFSQAELTSCGLNGKPLAGTGRYEARIACHLYSRDGAFWYGVVKRRSKKHPYFTQTGKDRENNPDQYVANFADGAVAGFKYFTLGEAKRIRLEIRSRAVGVVHVHTDLSAPPCARIPVGKTKGRAEFSAKFSAAGEKLPLYFTFSGRGSFDFFSFTLC